MKTGTRAAYIEKGKYERAFEKGYPDVHLLALNKPRSKILIWS